MSGQVGWSYAADIDAAGVSQRQRAQRQYPGKSTGNAQPAAISIAYREGRVRRSWPGPRRPQRRCQRRRGVRTRSRGRRHTQPFLCR